MENQNLIIINIVLSTLVPIIANSLQECFRIANKIKSSKCCNNNIEFKEDKDIIEKKV